MKAMTKPDHGREMYDPWKDFFDVENFFPGSLMKQTRGMLPAVNVSEDDKHYYVDVVAPGFKKEDFKVNIDDDMLTISAESTSESTNGDGKEGNKQYSRREYSYSSFTRSFRLPDDVEDAKIRANYADGILKLDIPKSQTQSRPKKEIRID